MAARHDLPTEPGDARAWIFGIARDCLLNHDRSRRRQAALAVRLAGAGSPTFTAGAAPDAADGVVEDRDIPLPTEDASLVVQTAWAVLTLMSVGAGDDRVRRAVDRGVAYLLARHGADGAWPSERATGVFFNTAVLDYRLYRQVFPAWALARYLGRDPAPA